MVELADGSRYSLSHSGDLTAPSLSPNGRLLVAPFDRPGYAVRDLAGDLPPWLIEPTLDAARWQPSAWSPDNRWLIMWSPRGPGGGGYARVDTVDHTVVTYQAPAGMHVIAALPGGELVIAPDTWSAAASVLVPGGYSWYS